MDDFQTKLQILNQVGFERKCIWCFELVRCLPCKCKNETTSLTLNSIAAHIGPLHFYWPRISKIIQAFCNIFWTSKRTYKCKKLWRHLSLPLKANIHCLWKKKILQNATIWKIWRFCASTALVVVVVGLEKEELRFRVRGNSCTSDIFALGLGEDLCEMWCNPEGRMRAPRAPCSPLKSNKKSTHAQYQVLSCMQKLCFHHFKGLRIKCS